MDQQIPVALGSASVYDNPNSTEMEVLMGSVIKCWGPVSMLDQPIDGQYLESFDPDADGGLGRAIFTNKIKKAKVFLNQMEAVQYWQQQSTVRPIREDGRPNRPLTSFSAAFENV